MGLTSKVLRNEQFFQYTWNFLRHRFRGKKIKASPIFLVGCGHSGTSLLLRLLGAHSNIYAVPYESRLFMHSYFKRLLVPLIWSRNAIANNKSRWVEKTPAHVRYIDSIFSRFPDAKVIVILRDGRDVTVSLRKRFGDFNKGLRRWIEDNSMGISKRDDPRVMTVKYENLVKHYQETMPKICSFLEENFEEGLIRYYEDPAYIYSKDIKNPGSGEGRKHGEYRNWQINQKIFDGSGKWAKEMTEEEKRLFKANSDAMLLLQNFGYVVDDNW